MNPHLKTKTTEMNLNIELPDHTGALFDYLQKGLFISSNSTNDEVREMYDSIDEHFESLSLFFAQIGYTLQATPSRKLRFLQSAAPAPTLRLLRATNTTTSRGQSRAPRWNRRYCGPTTG